MARENINVGTAANDGTGDTLRTTGTKINNNFIELYRILGGDSNVIYSNVLLGNNTISFEGLIANDYETVITVTEPTKDNTIIFPDSSGEVILDSAEQSLWNKHLYNTRIDGTLKLHGTSGSDYYVINYGGTLSSGDVDLTIPAIDSDDTWVFGNWTQTLRNKTLIEPTITDPRVDSDILDAAGNPSLHIKSVPSAINYLEIQAATSGNNPALNAVGAETNIDLLLEPKGTGKIRPGAPLRFDQTTYTTSGAISTNAAQVLFNDTTALVMTLANGANGQLMSMINYGTGTTQVTPTTFAQGTSFTMQPNAAIQLVYLNVNGWNIFGIDSAGGLGSMVTIA
jgi:hypothetical protein